MHLFTAHVVCARAAWLVVLVATDWSVNTLPVWCASVECTPKPVITIFARENTFASRNVASVCCALVTIIADGICGDASAAINAANVLLAWGRLLASDWGVVAFSRQRVTGVLSTYVVVVAVGVCVQAKAVAAVVHCTGVTVITVNWRVGALSRDASVDRARVAVVTTQYLLNTAALLGITVNLDARFGVDWRGASDLAVYAQPGTRLARVSGTLVVIIAVLFMCACNALPAIRDLARVCDALVGAHSTASCSVDTLASARVAHVISAWVLIIAVARRGSVTAHSRYWIKVPDQARRLGGADDWCVYTPSCGVASVLCKWVVVITDV